MEKNELANQLRQELKKAKSQNKIILALSAVSLIAAIVMGTLLLQNRSTNIIEPEEKLMSASLDADSMDVAQNNADLRIIDSLNVVIDTLSNRLNRANTEAETEEEVTDYVAQLLDNAKQFSGSNCNKSLAFLYAAKKIAQIDSTTDENKAAMNRMINKCEEALFGKKPDDYSATSAVN